MISLFPKDGAFYQLFEKQAEEDRRSRRGLLSVAGEKIRKKSKKSRQS